MKRAVILWACYWDNLERLVTPNLNRARGDAASQRIRNLHEVSQIASIARRDATSTKGLDQRRTDRR